MRRETYDHKRLHHRRRHHTTAMQISVATTATSTPTKQHYNDDDDYRRGYETMLTKFNRLYRHVYTIHIHNHQSIYSRNHSRRRKISSISAHTHLMTAASVRPSVQPTDRPTADRNLCSSVLPPRRPPTPTPPLDHCSHTGFFQRLVETITKSRTVDTGFCSSKIVSLILF